MSNTDDIAIIGLAGRFPGAASADALWYNLSSKICSIRSFSNDDCLRSGVPEELVNNSNYIKRKGYLDHSDCFDADFFKFSKHDAAILDPQFRLLIEVVWEAIENSGYFSDKLPVKTGVFVGASNVETYFQNYLSSPRSNLISRDFNFMLHNMKDFLPNLIAYKFNLRGPTLAVQTACSTSLVSVCMACQSIRSGESEVAIAGGTCVTTPLKAGYLYQEGMMLSKTGDYRAFDERSDGIVMGNGGGVVVLKSYAKAIEDNDTIHAVIKGLAVRNDGIERIGFTAPGVFGQQAALKAALDDAKLTPNDISYIETHGTGTILGDLVEIEALRNVYANCPAQSIPIGSIKPNIGHLDAAAGIANLIKLVSSLKNSAIPPTINYEHPSSQLQLQSTPFYVNVETQNWPNKENVYAGVSSFGMGGTNAHIILSNPPMPRARNTYPPIASNQKIILSAKSEKALKKKSLDLALYLENNLQQNIQDIAYTLQVGRKYFSHRGVFIAMTIDEVIIKLKNFQIEQHPPEIFAQWQSGGLVDFSDLWIGQKPKRIPLPAYQFDLVKHWISDEVLNDLSFKPAPSVNSQECLFDKTHVTSCIKETYEEYLLVDELDINTNFTDLGGDSIASILITYEINKKLNSKIPFSILKNNFSVKALALHITAYIENRT